MIPISLKLRGIYSYQEKEQFIDFSQLCDAGLFGIFGAVGSGKSTILEAISFALYGETERLNRRENRGYNMMNLKSDQLLIDFIFESTSNSNRYRFIVKGRRNSKRFDDVKTFKREAFKSENGEWLSISAESAEEITGLNYINFRRTIIIPQGRFQEFLQLGDVDRTKMMKELFQLERFDLSWKTKWLEGQNLKKLTDIEGQLKQVGNVSDEQVIKLIEEIKRIKLQLQEHKTALSKKEKKETELKALKELFDKIKLLENNLTELQNKKTQFEDLKKQLQEYQYCLIHFKDKINRIKEANEKQVQLTQEINHLTIDIEQKKITIDALNDEYIKLKPNFDKKEELNDRISFYTKLMEIKVLEADVLKLENRLTNGEKTLLDATSKIDSLEINKEKLLKESQNLKEEQPDLNELAKAKTWFVELKNLRGDKEKTDKKIAELKNDYENTLLKIKSELKTFEYPPDAYNFDEAINYLKNIANNKEQKTEEVEIALKKVKVKQELNHYTKNLHDGDACPVCGSTSHPDKTIHEDFNTRINELEGEIDKSKKELKHIFTAEKKLELSNNELETILKALTELETQSKKLISDIANFENSADYKKKYTEDLIEKLFTKAQSDSKLLKKIDDEIIKTDELIKKERENKDKYQKAIDEIKSHIVSKKASIETLFQQIKTQDYIEDIQMTDVQLKEKITATKTELNQLIDNYTRVEKELQSLKPHYDKLIGVLETKSKDTEKLSVEIEKMQETLLHQITQTEYSSVDEINHILSKSFDIEVENKKVADFENKLYSTKEQLQEIKAKAENKTFQPEELMELQKEIEEIKILIEQHNKQIGLSEKDKEILELKIKEKNKLTDEFTQLELRAGNIKTLKNLFKANGFVNYVSTVYLQNLLNAANVRFSALTGQKLRLELTETNDFIIRDYLNEGKTRSVKTLSGGQTFQASLSLALALADNIQSVNKAKSNFFFLDEGFGSLDKESLAIVFQSLKSLRKENRVVGVISHVEELQQEIDSYLKITNHAESGSLISKSWE